MESRKRLYTNYFDWLTPDSARRILLALGVAMIVGEMSLRLFQWQPPRTAVCSLHGIRTIYQQALDYKGQKVICVGDSTLMGGGVYEHDLIVMGQISKVLKSGPRIFNLAVPSGDITSSAVMLDSLRRAKIKDVERVIIEIM